MVGLAVRVYCTFQPSGLALVVLYEQDPTALNRSYQGDAQYPTAVPVQLYSCTAVLESFSSRYVKIDRSLT